MAKNGPKKEQRSAAGKSTVEYSPAFTGCPAVEYAIEGLYSEPSEDSFWTLITALNYALQMETKVLVPLQTAPGIPERAADWPASPVKGDGYKGLRTWMLHNENGKRWAPVFTSPAAAGSSRATAAAPMAEYGFEEIMERALKEDELDGLVINPWGQSATLDKDLLRGLLRSEPEEEKEPGREMLKAGREAGLAGDWENAVVQYSYACGEGSATGLRLVGQCFLNAWGVERDLDRAEKYLKTASEHGDLPAKVFLGDVFALRGDPGRALMQYRHAMRDADERPDIDFRPEICSRIAGCELMTVDSEMGRRFAAEAMQGFRIRQREGDPSAAYELERAAALLKSPEPPASSAYAAGH